MMQKHFFRWPPRTATWWSDSTSWLRYRRWLHRSSFLPLWQHRQNLQTRWYLQGTVRCQKVMQLSMKKVLNHLSIGCHVHEDCNGNEYCECDEGTGCPGGSVGSCRLGCRDQVSSACLHFFVKKTSSGKLLHISRWIAWWLQFRARLLPTGNPKDKKNHGETIFPVLWFYLTMWVHRQLHVIVLVVTQTTREPPWPSPWTTTLEQIRRAQHRCWTTREQPTMQQGALGCSQKTVWDQTQGVANW